MSCKTSNSILNSIGTQTQGYSGSDTWSSEAEMTRSTRNLQETCKDPKQSRQSICWYHFSNRIRFRSRSAQVRPALYQSMADVAFAEFHETISSYPFLIRTRYVSMVRTNVYVEKRIRYACFHPADIYHLPRVAKT